jgi:O-antigen ligase
VPVVYAPNLDAPFTAPKLALLLAAAGLAMAGEALAAGEVRESGAAPRRWPIGLAIALVGFLVTTLASAVVAVARGAPGAPYATTELARGTAVVGIALGAARAAQEPIWRRPLLRSIQAAAGVVSALGLLQHLQWLPIHLPVISVPGSTFGNRNMAAEAVAVAIPFGLASLAIDASRGRGRGAALPVRQAVVVTLELTYLAVTRTRGAWIGAALGILAFVALLRPPRSRLVLAAGALVVALATGAALLPGRFTERDALDVKRYQPAERLVLDAIDPTAAPARTRLGLWRRTLRLAKGHPWLGLGPGNFAVFFPSVAEPGARADGVLSPSEVPRRAHNDLVERLADTGIVGLTALLLVYGAAASIIARMPRPRRSRSSGQGGSGADDGDEGCVIAYAGAASLTASIACGMTAFPLAMPATTLAFGIALGAIAGGARAAAFAPAPVKGPPGSVTPPLDAREPRQSPARSGRRAAAWAFAVGAVAAALVAGGREVVASYWLARGQRAARAGEAGDAAFDAFARAERTGDAPFRAPFLTALAAVRAGQGPRAVAAAERALAVEPFAPHAWAARASGALASGDLEGAVAGADRALALLHDYPAALEIRALAAARKGDIAAGAAARERLRALAASDGSPIAKEATRLLERLGALPGPPEHLPRP